MVVRQGSILLLPVSRYITTIIALPLSGDFYYFFVACGSSFKKYLRRISAIYDSVEGARARLLLERSSGFFIIIEKDFSFWTSHS